MKKMSSLSSLSRYTPLAVIFFVYTISIAQQLEANLVNEPAYTLSPNYSPQKSISNNWNSYSNSSIIIIEDSDNSTSSTDTSGLLIKTSESNFAIYSPNFKGKNWLAISVNGESVRIISTNKKSLTTRWGTLSDKTKTDILKIKSKFNQNLAGISLTPCNCVKGMGSSSSSYDSSSSYAKRGYGQNGYASGNKYTGAPGPSLVPYGGNYNNNNNNNNNKYQAALQYPSVIFNNLNDKKLNNTLDGDVYNLCIQQPIVDIFSTSVSFQLKENLISIYRDYRYFAYRKPTMGNNINTFFLNNNLVFFVYNNGIVEVKTSYQLTDDELDIVVDARSLVKDIEQLVDNALEVQLGDSLDLIEDEIGDIEEKLNLDDTLDDIDGKVGNLVNGKLQKITKVLSDLEDKLNLNGSGGDSDEDDDSGSASRSGDIELEVGR